MVTILLADDHRVLRDGVRRLLEETARFSVVATADTGLEAVEKAERARPNVALVDISMPLLSGIEVTRSIRERAPQTAVVILSMHSSGELVREAVRAGARGYLLKESAGEEVVHAVQAVSAGQRFFGQSIAQVLATTCLDERARPAVERLTPRELDVVRLVAEGKSNAETASHLGLSPRSVETYRLRLMQKLALDDLASLVKFAIRHGLTTLD